MLFWLGFLWLVVKSLIIDLFLASFMSPGFVTDVFVVLIIAMHAFLIMTIVQRLLKKQYTL